MEAKELFAKRIELFHDAIRMEKTPERTPHISNFYTWLILDDGKKLSETINDWGMMEEAIIHHQEKYNFDNLRYIGTRNPIRLIRSLGESRYLIDDEREVLGILDWAGMEPSEYPQITENFYKTLWDTFLPRRFPKLHEMTDEDIQTIINEFMAMMGYTQKVSARLQNEFGVPATTGAIGLQTSGLEHFITFFRGIKGISTDMRRHPEEIKAAVEKINQDAIYPVLQQMKAMPSGSVDTHPFDAVSAILAHTILNRKQFEEIYWSSLKAIFDTICEKDKTIYILVEGDFARFFDLIQDYPKGHLGLHLEIDDIFEARKKLPNCCLIGGMTSSVLGNGTQEECINLARKLMDEVGPEGFIMSQNKMMSYRTDAKAENVLAVCEYVRQTKF